MKERSLLQRARGSWFALAAMLLLLQVTVATAATRFWRNNVGSGNWSAAANWSSVSAADTNPANNGTPLATEPVIIANTDGTARTITYDVASLAIGSLTIDLTGAGTTTETLSIAANALTVNGLVNVGNTGRGSVNQTGGTATINSTLFVGTATGAVGGYSLSSTGSLSTTNNVNVGVAGTGTFNQSGGTNTVTADLVIGLNATAFGTYTMSGGTLSTGGAQFVGSSATGNLNQSGGTFNQSGGSNTATNGLNVGFNANSTGVYTLSGNGTLSVAQAETIGNNGKGIFNQTGGTHTSNAATTFFRLGVTAGSAGTYNLSGTGSFISNTSEFIGVQGLGEFFQNGGTHTILGAGHNLNLGGAGVAPTATYTLNSGNLTASQSSELIGNAGPALFSQTGGSNSTSSLQIAVAAGIAATYTLSGGGLAAVDESIGIAGNGTLTQTGGVNTATTISIGVANNSTSNGAYNLSAGSATASSVTLGNSAATNATGVLTVSGTGVLSVSNTLAVANSGSTSLNLNGGTINAAALNFNGVPLRFNWTTGKLNLTQDVTWDSAAAPTTTAAAFGSSRMLDNGQTLMVSGNETLGPTGAFTLTLDSGSTHQVTGNLTIGPGGTIMQNSGSTLYAATITQAGGVVNGTLQNQATFVYQSGLFNGRLLNQGTVSFVASLVTGNGVQNDGNMTLASGKTMTVNGTGLDNLGRLTLTGGSVSGNGPAVNNFGGTLEGQGTVNNTFTNNGLLLVGGVLRFNGATATNNGFVRGNGTITGNFANATGGTLDLTNTNLLAISGAADTDADGLNEWSNAGLITLGNGAVLGSAQIVNSGTVRGAGSINARLTNSGIVRAEGGQLTLGGSGHTNAAAGLIQAAAGNTIMVLPGLAMNSGTIALSGGTFDNNNHLLSNPGVINGYGTVRASGLTNNNKINVSEGNMDLFGSVTNNSTINIQSARSLFFFGNVNGPGSFTGAGTAVFLAALTPGSSPGTVSFVGNATLESASALNIELGGTAGSQFDQLLVTGALSLGGVLNVSMVNGFSPTAGQSFDILNWGSLSGTFATLNLPTLPGLTWNTSQLYTNGVLSVATAAGIPGDYTSNGTVDAADYILWRKYQNTTHVFPNDPAGGTIGPAQYATWRSNYGKPSGSGSIAFGSDGVSVPEPMMSAMAIVLSLFASMVRQKNRVYMATKNFRVATL